MYLLKLALRPWKKAAWVQVLSALSFSFFAFLVSLLFWMDRELKPLVQRLRTDQVITAYMSPGVSQQEETGIVDSIRMTVGAAPDIQVVEPSAFLDELKQSYPQLSDEIAQLGPEMKTAVPKFVSIAGLIPASQVEHVRGIKGIESVEISQNKLRSAAGPFQTLRLFSKIIMIGLCLAWFCGILLLGRMVRGLHLDTMQMMDLLGASHFEKRIPSLLSGSMIGLVSGVIASIGWIWAAPLLIKSLRSFSPALIGMNTPSPVLAGAIFVVCLLMGSWVGLSGGDSRIGK